MRFQYPIQAALDPEALSVAQRDELQWFRSFFEPMRQLGTVAATAALIASTGVAPMDPVEPPAVLDTGIEWYVPLSEPVPPRHLFQRAETAVIDPTTLDEALRDELQWFQGLSEPTRRVAEAVEGGRFFVDEIEVSTDTSFEWFAALSEPVLPLPWHQPEYWFSDPTTLDASLRDEIQWWRDLDVPALRRVSAENMPAFFIDPEALGEVGVSTGIWTNQPAGATSWSDDAVGTTIWSDDAPGSTGWSDA